MSEPAITVYTPDSSLTNPLIMVRATFRDLFACRGPAWRLAVRDIRAQYRQASGVTAITSSTEEQR